jgi:hypothetical protein
MSKTGYVEIASPLVTVARSCYYGMHSPVIEALGGALKNFNSFMRRRHNFESGADNLLLVADGHSQADHIKKYYY